jgi:hypothetical protein
MYSSINYPAASERGIKRNTFPKRPKGRGTDPSADGELGAANKTLEILRLALGINSTKYFYSTIVCKNIVSLI